MCDPCAGFVGPGWIHEVFSRLAFCADELCCAESVEGSISPSLASFWRETHFSFSYQLVRPEFQAFLENEQKTLDLVRDVADTLDNIAANPLHTPALYSGFLRALISAKLDQQQQPSSHHSLNGDEKMISASLSDGGEQQLQQQLQQQAQLQQQHQLGAADGDAHTPNSYSHHGNALHLFGGGDGGHNGNFMLNEFQFESEMGPVADISTFPPTMAPHPSEDSLGALTMENILSSGFWDSMLVPGAFGLFCVFFEELFIDGRTFMIQVITVWTG